MKNNLSFDFPVNNENSTLTVKREFVQLGMQEGMIPTMERLDELLFLLYK